MHDRDDDSLDDGAREADPAGQERLWTPRFTALLASQAFFGYAFSSFFLLPTYLSRELGASATQVGSVMSIASAAIVLLLPVAGHATDRLGRRRFLVLGGALMGIASLGFALVDTLGPLLYALRLAQAIAFSLTFAAGGALAADLAPRDRIGQAVGLYGLTFLSMNGVASASVEALAASAGWAAAFMSAGVAALVSGGLSLFLRELPSRGAGDGASDASDSGSSAVPVATLCIMALVGLALGAMFNFAQLYAALLGARNVGTFFVTYAATGVVVRAGFGHLLDAWGLRRVATGALALYAGVLVATIWLDGFGLAVIGCGLGLAHGVFYPAFTGVSLQEASLRARGRVIGYTQAAFSLGGTASAGLGLVADRAGYPAVFGIAAVGLLAALVLLVRRPRSSPRAWAGGAPAGSAASVIPARPDCGRTLGSC